MKKISRPKELSVMIAAIILMLAAIVLSACICYVTVNNRGTEERSISTPFEGKDNENIRISYIKNDTYTTPEGTFAPIEHILEINEYMTANPTLLSTDLSKLYITENGDANHAREVMNEVRRLSDSICKGQTSEYDKAYALAMWVGTHIAYDHDAADDEVSSLSVTSLESIINNDFRTTCAGFSNLFSALCYSQGIYCLNMKGGAAGPGWKRSQLEEIPANHEWNAVAVDGIWYYADCTWISDLSYENGEYYGGEDVKPFYALFCFGEMSIEHRIDRCEYRTFSIPAE